MKKKSTAKKVTKSSRQSTLNFPTSSEADLVAESAAAEGSTKSGAKNRRKRTADFADDADKHNESHCDSSVPVSSTPTERNKIAEGKKRSTAALGQHPSTTESPEGATDPSSSAKNRRRRTADLANDADKHNKAQCDSSAISAKSAVKTARGSSGQGMNAEHPSWSNAPLSDLVHSIDQGWSPRCENHAASSHSEWAVIKTTAIQNLQFLDQENKALPSTLEPRKHLELRAGDLLITRAGPRNRVGVACLVRSTRPRLMLCDKAYRLKCRLDVVEPAFLELALNSPDLVSQVNKLKTGINDSGVNITQTPFMNLEIPVPPIAEQHRIVAEIEKQFTRLDAGVAALKRVQANLKRYRAAVLKAACEGKLVPTEAELARNEGRNYETGEQLLQRILTERRQNWQGRGQYQEPAAAATSLPLLPEGWTWATAQQLNLANRPCAYGVLQPGEEVPDGVPFVRVGDINNGRVELANIKRISAVIAAQYPRTKLHGGELAITLVGAIGRTAIIPESLANGNTARAVGIIPLTKQVNAHWVEICFRNPAKRAEMESKSHEVARKTLNLEDVRVASVALPPLAEQIRIVAEVERCLSMVEELESVVVTNLQRAIHLRQSILQRAFIGEL